MRDRHDEIQRHGAEVVMIGTGDLRLAKRFVQELEIPFPVLVDEDAAAAKAADVRRVGFFRLFHPDSYPGLRRAWKAGHRLGKPGKRTDQLGATFVVGPGPAVHYVHYDAHTADHAPMAEVLAALKG